MKCVSQEEDDSHLPSSAAALSPVLANIFSISSTTVKDTAIEAESIDRNYLVMTYTLSLNTKEIPTHALIDCGAMGYAFIDQGFADCHKLPLCPLKTPHALEVINR
jgi:hypothetical protein